VITIISVVYPFRSNVIKGLALSVFVQVYEDAVESQKFFIKIRDELCKNGETLLSPALTFTRKMLDAELDQEKKVKRRNRTYQMLSLVFFLFASSVKRCVLLNLSALGWRRRMSDAPQTGCVRRITPICT